MKIAVACDGLVVAPYFVQCTSYTIYTVKLGRIVDSRNLVAFDQTLRQLGEMLHSLDIDVLIVGRIEPDVQAFLASFGLEIVPNAEDDPLVSAREYLTSIFSAVED